MQNGLFKFDLTPQRKHLLAQTRARIHRETLRTSDLQLCLLFFREIKLDDWFWESGSAIAHARRDQGLFWSWALNVWTTHLYYQHLDRNDVNVRILPADVFRTISRHIEKRQEWQLAEELRDIFPSGTTRLELLSTLEHMYSPRLVKGKLPKEDTFLHLVSERGNEDSDLRMIRRLILQCEEQALNILPVTMDEIVDAIDLAFKRLKISGSTFTQRERVYLKLHLLVSFHNLLFDVHSKTFKDVTGIDAPKHEAMLSVSAMESTLTLDISFCYLEKGKFIEEADLHTTDRMGRLRYPLLDSQLPEKEYLLESDQNIRACLYNHPLEVRHYDGSPIIVALERQSARYTPTRSRRSQETFPWGTL